MHTYIFRIFSSFAYGKLKYYIFLRKLINIEICLALFFSIQISGLSSVSIVMIFSNNVNYFENILSHYLWNSC